MLRFVASVVVVALGLGGCDRVFSLDRIDAPLAPDVPGATVDARIPGLAFDTPIALSTINTPDEEDRPTLSSDLLELYFHRFGAIWRSTRPDTVAEWSAPAPVTVLNTGGAQRPCLTADDLSIYMSKIVSNQQNIYVATRTNRGAEWDEPVLLAGTVNDIDGNELCGWESTSGLTFLYTSDATDVGDRQIFRATRTSRADSYVGVEFQELNSAGNEGAPWAIASGTVMMFDSDRGGTTKDLYETFQTGIEWKIVPHPELNTPMNDGSAWLSPDGTVLYFASNRDGNDNLYYATRGIEP